jgi:peptidylprolyl isomerase
MKSFTYNIKAPWLMMLMLTTMMLIFDLSPVQGKENKPMSANTVIIMETTQGNIEIALMTDVAPKATENFLKLAEKEYYNGLTFHRIIKDFMIQGGDPTGTGAGGESIWGKPFEDEYNVDVTFDRPNLLAMANAGPNTNGSQFFITTIATPWLTGKHTIFGEVIKGQDIIKKLEGVKTGAMDKPVEAQKILKITVKEKQPQV